MIWKRTGFVVSVFMSRRGLLLAYILLLLTIIILAGAAGGSQAGEKIGTLMSRIPACDKVGHFLLFGTLAFLAHLSCAHRERSALRWLLVTLVVTAVVVAEECTQIWLPNRSFDLGDIAADLGGIVVFSVFAYLAMRRRMGA